MPTSAATISSQHTKRPTPGHSLRKSTGGQIRCRSQAARSAPCHSKYLCQLTLLDTHPRISAVTKLVADEMLHVAQSDDDGIEATTLTAQKESVLASW